MHPAPGIYCVSINGLSPRYFASQEDAEIWLKSQGAHYDPQSGDWYTLDEQGEPETWYTLQEIEPQ